jgi:pyruvate dehydrogenase E2 component (dihydrolipoamide acetyltransferase)
MSTELRLPETETGDPVKVIKVFVAPGTAVKKDQELVTVGTSKASVDLTAPSDGTVVKFLVEQGKEATPGKPYCIFEPAGSTDGAAAAPKAAAREAAPAEAPAAPSRPAAPPARATPPAAPAPAPNRGVVAAGPGTRLLARKMGVDLRQVSGSGRNGRVTPEDVERFAEARSTGVVTAAKLPNFKIYGDIRTEPLSPIREAIAQKMALAWSVIPHVTQHDLADITDLEDFRQEQNNRLAATAKKDEKAPRLTMTVFALKAVVVALQKFPKFNASLDVAGKQLILKSYYNIGVAVDTPEGLLVPVIRNVDQKSLLELARELTLVADKARQGKADMSGGCFTISNLGGIGGVAFTPIANHPEVAILGMARSSLQPVVKDGQIMPRLMLPLSLSYDHRVIDGAEAARFARFLAELLEDPMQMLLYL